MLRLLPWLLLSPLTAVAMEALEGPVATQEEPFSELVEPKRSRFAFHGFGTLGLVHSSEDQADFVADLVRPEGPGFSRDWSAASDSRLGLQLTVELTGRLSAVVQGIVEQQFDEDYEPTLEWANLKYAFTALKVQWRRAARPRC